MWSGIQEPQPSERTLVSIVHTSAATAELRTLPYTPDPLFEALLSRAASHDKTVAHAANGDNHDRSMKVVNNKQGV